MIKSKDYYDMMVSAEEKYYRSRPLYEVEALIKQIQSFQSVGYESDDVMYLCNKRLEMLKGIIKNPSGLYPY